MSKTRREKRAFQRIKSGPSDQKIMERYFAKRAEYLAMSLEDLKALLNAKMSSTDKRALLNTVMEKAQEAKNKSKSESNEPHSNDGIDSE